MIFQNSVTYDDDDRKFSIVIDEIEECGKGTPRYERLEQSKLNYRYFIFFVANKIHGQALDSSPSLSNPVQKWTQVTN